MSVNGRLAKLERLYSPHSSPADSCPAWQRVYVCLDLRRRGELGPGAYLPGMSDEEMRRVEEWLLADPDEATLLEMAGISPEAWESFKADVEKKARDLGLP